MADKELFYKIVRPQPEDKKFYPCIIFLHGRGADENDLLPLSKYFGNEYFVISVRAPYEWDYGFGYTWFQMKGDFNPDMESLYESLNLLEKLLDEIPQKFPVDKNKIVTFGFSMGAVMGNLMLLLHPERITSHISHSGYLPEGHDLKFKSIENKSVFIAHGVHDQIIPIQLARRTKEIFTQLKAELVYKEYPIEHHISEDSINDIINWLILKNNKL